MEGERVGGGYKFFSCLVTSGWENFKFPGGLLFWGYLISFLIEEIF